MCRPKAAFGGDWETMKILLAADDGDALERLAAALRREGFSVITAGDGNQALQCWRADYECSIM